MLRNLYPMLDSAVLSALEAMRSGELVLLAAGDFPREHGGPQVFEFPVASLAAAVTALLEVYPLPRDGAPIAYRDQPWVEDGLPDAAFTVGGAAADATRRLVSMTRLTPERFHALALTAPVTLLVDRLAAPTAFLLRRA